VDTVSIDSRSLQNSSPSLFLPCCPNNDAHVSIADLIEIGVQNFVVSYIPAEVRKSKLW
jgi:alanine racemase